MPGGDRTGPMGMGGRAGRAAGYCGGFGIPGYANPAAGRGFGMGFFRGRGALGRGFIGGGRGWRNTFYATGLPGWMRFGGYAAPYRYGVPYQKPDVEMEKQALKNQAQTLREELDFIEKQLAKIEAGTTEQQT
jgi:hypothetical protein